MGKIKRTTARDKDLIRGIARTGLASKTDALEKLGLSERRLRNLEKENYVTSKEVVVDNKTLTIYRLDKQGKKWIKENTDIDRVYRSNERQIEHDLKLSSIYYNLPFEQKETWKNEYTLIDEYKTNFPDTERSSMVDATVEIEGHTVAIEVITSNYSNAEIADKHSISEKIGCEKIITIKA